jgi:hypothetical protein
VAFYNGHFLATAGRAEGLDILDNVKRGDRWRGGGMYNETERLERKQVDLVIDGPGGGERRVMSAVIHVIHVKREGVPKRNTRAGKGYSLCAEVIELCFVTNKQFMFITNLLCCVKFQSCDIICYPRVQRGREIDGLLKVRCLYTHVSPSMYENQIMDKEIGCACT